VPAELEKEGDAPRPDRIQIYKDEGEGYSEEASYFPEKGYDLEGQTELSLSFLPQTRAFRVDPANQDCLLTVNFYNPENLPVRLALSPGGEWIGGGLAVFRTKDPFVEVYVPEDQREAFSGGEVSLSLVMALLPESLAGKLSEAPENAHGKEKRPAFFKKLLGRDA
ncbi:MAG: hypothetical protein IJU50_07520, partial [Lachnospiraceae bacterium]|nr:hypothetical protein [Lachnospiraceae bacterium]